MTLQHLKRHKQHETMCLEREYTVDNHLLCFMQGKGASQKLDIFQNFQGVKELTPAMRCSKRLPLYSRAKRYTNCFSCNSQIIICYSVQAFNVQKMLLSKIYGRNPSLHWPTKTFRWAVSLCRSKEQSYTSYAQLLFSKVVKDQRQLLNTRSQVRNPGNTKYCGAILVFGNTWISDFSKNGSRY